MIFLYSALLVPKTGPRQQPRGAVYQPFSRPSLPHSLFEQNKDIKLIFILFIYLFKVLCSTVMMLHAYG